MEFIEKTIGEIVGELAKKYPDNLAVKSWGGDFERTWKELDEETDRIAKGLMALGVQKGDKVSVWATNIPEWILALFATTKIGAILVTVNTNYKIFELEYLLRQSDTKVLVMMKGFKDSDYISIINTLLPDLKNSTDGSVKADNLPMLERVIFAGKDTPAGMLPFNDIVKYADKVSDEEYEARKATLHCHEVINIQYTSGTTGFPKGVMLTHYNILNNGKTIGDGMKFTENDKLCICVPLFHCFGLVLGVMACITHATS
ncbi:MAG: AMP-binding protein, partial [Clostridiales bacterium]|nr:AMP-binding protein [Clostridiales bacterium]